MVSYDRIYQEIQIEARRISESLDIDPEALASLALEIVDLEDRHIPKKSRSDCSPADQRKLGYRP